jgi:ABC-type enterobactin transport system permease subunit
VTAPGGVIVERVIPLPRPWMLTSAMLVGAAIGLVAAVTSTLLITATVRPDVVIALVVGVPSVVGVVMILCSGRRWVTTLGAFVLAIAPGWLGALALIEVVNGG